ncbi:MAG: amidohydrolase family protein [Phycisphaerae bacterium]
MHATAQPPTKTTPDNPTATDDPANPAAPAVTADPADPADPGLGQALYIGDELLKPYDPEPALVVPQNLVQKPKFPVIDVHCHWGPEVSPDFLLQSMDDLGVKAAVNLSGGYGPKLEAMLARYHDAAPGRLLILMNLPWENINEPDFGPRNAAYIEAMHAKGVAGLKIFKSLGLTTRDDAGNLVRIDDPRLDPIWAKCGELGIPVLIHAADPVAFFQPIDAKNERWLQLHRHPSWSFYGEQFPSREEVLNQRDTVLGRHPGTTFIGAHVANNSEDLAALRKRLEKYPNLVADISGRVAELGRQPYSARRLFMDYPDRILFGTDRYPGRPDQPRYRIYYRFLETADEYFKYYDHPFPPTGEWRIYGIHLPDDVLRKVYHENAERIFGLDAEPN